MVSSEKIKVVDRGLNKANIWDKLSWLLKSSSNKPCVFLSHKREDKQHCKLIASYLSNVGIDYYLDENDNLLQTASTLGDGKAITECIKNGIKESTHMMVVVSESTYQSQWVPFEVGYGHAVILDFNNDTNNIDRYKLSVLTLKDLSEKPLPDYLLTAHLIRGTKGLNEYIRSITAQTQKSQLNEACIQNNNDFNHPLDKVLNWKL